MSIDYTKLPEHMRAGMQRYLEHGVWPGAFLCAVLSNDLIGAVRFADDANAAALPDYVRFLYCQAPADSYGSTDDMKRWIASVGAASNVIAAE